MATVTFDITMSLDGFVAGPDANAEQPLGAGGEELHEWAISSRDWRERHGLAGGEVNADSGANVAQQALRAGLADEMQVHVAPILLGGDVRLFDNLGPGIGVELVRTVSSPKVTHLKYRIAK